MRSAARSFPTVGFATQPGWQVATLLCAAVLVGRAVQAADIPADLFGVHKKSTVIEAFRPAAGFDRHDPSNVIRHAGRFWAFYTRNVSDHAQVSVWAASSVDGVAWRDEGEALGRASPGAWDESGAIAPYVVRHRGRFHLYYTGFRGGDLATRDLGCAIADQPTGPWTRWAGNPLLRRDPDPEAWDSGMLGDANVIFFNDRWWLYYKSRRGDETSADTRIGVATAREITGPYERHAANPLFAGHAFSAWRRGAGVAALCGEISPRILWSADGLRFAPAGEMPNQSTGLFTPEEGDDPEHRRGFDWGLEVYEEHGTRGLRRFDAARRPPNIVFILADDLGYGDIGPFGQRKIRTPALDRLAAAGVCCDHYYSGAAVCAPSRCALLTGLHTGHGRVRGNHGLAGLDRVPLEPDDVTVAEVLGTAGYATAAIGKWGLGEPGTTGVPTRQGFDRWFGYLNQDLAEDYFPATIWRDEREEALPGNAGGARGQYSNDLMTDEAIGFVEANRDRPFFLYLAYTLPHAAWEVPADSLAEYAGRFPEPATDPAAGKPQPGMPRATYAAMVSRLDRSVGRVLDRITSLGLDDDTVVFFTSDNGAPRRKVVADFFGSHGPFREGKGSLHEGGIRAPMIVRWPGRIAAGTRSDFPWAGWDFLPTAAALAGVAAPPGLDGIDVVPALCGRGCQRDEPLYWERIGRGQFGQAVRIGDMKAIRDRPDAALEVYDLRRDPGETTDLAAAEPGLCVRAQALFRSSRSESEHWPVAPAAPPR